MEAAYLKASANGKLPAHARQVMYAARPYIQRTADRELGKQFDQYFTQQLLPDYIEEHGLKWNVAFDARGNFLLFESPATRLSVPAESITRASLPDHGAERGVLDLGVLTLPEPEVAFRGRVVDPEGQPVRGASVWPFFR